jgi:hypothetical protein
MNILVIHRVNQDNNNNDEFITLDLDTTELWCGEPLLSEVPDRPYVTSYHPYKLADLDTGRITDQAPGSLLPEHGDGVSVTNP